MSNEELALLAQKGDTAARGSLWEQNQGLLTQLFARYFPLCQHYHCEPDDLLQCGYFVICKAVEAYNPEKGLKFTSYLKHHVQNAVNETFCTRGDKKRHWDVSGNTPVGTEGEAELLDLQPDPEATRPFEDVEATLYNQQLHSTIEACMAEKLDERQSDLLRRIYYQGEPLAQLGEAMGISIARVNQVRARALYQMARDRRIRAYREDIITRHAYRGGYGLFKARQASSTEWAVELVEAMHARLEAKGREMLALAAQSQP